MRGGSGRPIYPSVAYSGAQQKKDGAAGNRLAMTDHWVVGRLSDSRKGHPDRCMQWAFRVCEATTKMYGNRTHDPECMRVSGWVNLKHLLTLCVKITPRGISESNHTMVRGPHSDTDRGGSIKGVGDWRL